MGSFEAECVDTSTVVGGDNGIAVDSDGRPHIVYRNYANEAVKYAYWNGSTWETSVVSSSGGANEGTKIAVDSAGIPHIVYETDDTEKLYYAVLDGSQWEIEAITNMGNPSIVVDSQSKPHVAHTYSGGDDPEILRYSYREDG